MLTKIKFWFKRKFVSYWDITKPESDVYIGCVGTFYSEFEFRFRQVLHKQDLDYREKGETDSRRLNLLRDMAPELATEILRSIMEERGRCPRR